MIDKFSVMTSWKDDKKYSTILAAAWEEVLER
jgi:hypothetical protein